MRWIPLWTLCAIGCGPERPGRQYVHELSYYNNLDGGMQGTSGSYQLVRGRRQVTEGELGRLKPYEPPFLAYSEHRDADGDGVDEFTTSTVFEADGTEVATGDFDGDGVGDAVYWYDVDGYLVRYQDSQVSRNLTRDARHRLTRVEVLQRVAGSTLEQVDAYTYQGDSEDWVTHTVDDEVVTRVEVDSQGLWVMRYAVGVNGERETNRRTLNDDGRVLEQVDTNADGQETVTSYTRNEFGHRLTYRQTFVDVLVRSGTIERDEDGHALKEESDTDGDGTIDLTTTFEFELDAYGRYTMLRSTENGEVIGGYERTLLGTIDEVELNRFTVEPAPDFGW